MKLTQAEKLTLVMLADIQEKLGINESVDPTFVKRAILDDSAWGLSSRYQALLGNEEPLPSHVREVFDILDVWRMVKYAMDAFSPAEKAAAERAAGGIKFKGFDGLNESDHRTAATFIVEQLDLYPESKADALLDAHGSVLSNYRRMVAVYKGMRGELSGNPLNVAQVVEILSAFRHPKPD